MTNYDKAIEISETLANDPDFINDFMFHVCIEAKKYFERANCIDDFCLQSQGGGIIIFGGWNRLGYDFEKGFYPVKSNCSEQFLNANKDFFNIN